MSIGDGSPAGSGLAVVRPPGGLDPQDRSKTSTVPFGTKTRAILESGARWMA
jgi:hypothetical protein